MRRLHCGMSLTLLPGLAQVRFLTWGGNIVSNKSPIVTQIPVMPVVYPATGVATFQVAAYDPDYGSRRDQARAVAFSLRLGGMQSKPLNPMTRPCRSVSS